MNVRPLSPDQDQALLSRLADLLLEAVEDGASISFMAGLTHDEALAFWQARLDATRGGKHAILAAFQGPELRGTVSLSFDTPPNQPHRADVQKMIVAKSHQRRGLGATLLTHVEAQAKAHNRWLLCLDTISGSPAARLYERCGWQRVGDIPAYALMPHGGLAPTTVYFKRLP